jgi:hypothetical protein
MRPPPKHAHRAVGVFVDADGGLYEARSQRAFGNLQTATIPGHGVVVANLAFLLHAQDLPIGAIAIGDKHRAVLLGFGRAITVPRR